MTRTVYLCRGAFCYGLDYPPTTERPHPRDCLSLTSAWPA